MRVRAKLLALAGAVMGMAWPLVAATAADDPGYLVIGAGSWETLREPKAEVDLAYRSGYKLWIFKPHFGLMVAQDGDYYGYGGLLTDIYWGRHIVLTLSTAVGGYGGGGYDLGSHVEFRSGGELAWRFENRSRVGVGFYHISNAGLTSRNPGSESALMTFSYPLDRLFKTNAYTAAAPQDAPVAGFSRYGVTR